jgi:hypothetical protein
VYACVPYMLFLPMTPRSFVLLLLDLYAVRTVLHYELWIWSYYSYVVQYRGGNSSANQDDS